MSVPAVYPALSIASSSNCSAASFDGRLGAKPPSSPTVVAMPFASISFFRACERLPRRSAALRETSARRAAPA